MALLETSPAATAATADAGVPLGVSFPISALRGDSHAQQRGSIGRSPAAVDLRSNSFGCDMTLRVTGAALVCAESVFAQGAVRNHRD